MDNKNELLAFHKERALSLLLNRVDGTILQAERTLEAELENRTERHTTARHGEYFFSRVHHEMMMFLISLAQIVHFVDNLRSDQRFELDTLQTVKTKLRGIDRKLLMSVRNDWTHIENVSLGKSRDQNKQFDLETSLGPWSLMLQIIGGEVRVATQPISLLNADFVMDGFTNEYISVPKTLTLMQEIRADICEIIKETCPSLTIAECREEARS